MKFVTQGLFIAIKTMGIVKELIEIWPNEVCDKYRPKREGNGKFSFL